MSRITQKGATAPLGLQANGTFQSTTDVNLATLVGSRFDLEDGREVILVSTPTATTATPGVLYQDAAIVPNHQNLAVATITPYSANGNVPYSIIATLGNTATTANQYAGGYLLVNAGTGKGQTLLIASNAAVAGSGTCAIVLEDGPNTALAVSDSKVSLIPPHGANIIIFPTTATGAAVGVGLYTLPVASYGFVVSKGITSAISDAIIPAVGASVSYSTTTAGTITATPSQNTVATLIVGYANQTAVSAEARSIFVNL